MRVASVVGARPQFIKAAPLCRALRRDHEEILIHSGQHYDYAMSEVFFSELGIPKPDYNLGVGSGGHGRQTGEMLGLLEELFIEIAPDVVVVYGDTNTTLAGGLAAAKLHVPVVHVEAGLRSFDRRMPEEINRVVVDHVSDLLLCPTEQAVKNLAEEGVTDGVERVGDLMLDTARHFSERLPVAEVLASFGVEAGEYCFATLHRAATSDDAGKLRSVLAALARMDVPVVFAVHPRTEKNVRLFGLEDELKAGSLRPVPPVSYMEAICLLSNARLALTDSGGMQKEAYFFGVPCVTLRDTTEWVETVETGWNTLAGTDTDRILEAARGARRPAERPDLYGDGHAAEATVAAIERRYLPADTSPEGRLET